MKKKLNLYLIYLLTKEQYEYRIILKNLSDKYNNVYNMLVTKWLNNVINLIKIMTEKKNIKNFEQNDKYITFIRGKLRSDIFVWEKRTKNNSIQVKIYYIIKILRNITYPIFNPLSKYRERILKTDNINKTITTSLKSNYNYLIKYNKPNITNANSKLKTSIISDDIDDMLQLIKNINNSNANNRLQYNKIYRFLVNSKKKLKIQVNYLLEENEYKYLIKLKDLSDKYNNLVTKWLNNIIKKSNKINEKNSFINELEKMYNITEDNSIRKKIENVYKNLSS